MTDYIFANINKNKIKKEAFIEKRKEIFDEIVKILGLEPNNPESTIKKEVLDTKYEDINKLLNDIFIYYPSSVTNVINKTNNKTMSIIRLILKHFNYKLKYKAVACYKSDKTRTTTQLYSIVSV